MLAACSAVMIEPPSWSDRLLYSTLYSGARDQSHRPTTTATSTATAKIRGARGLPRICVKPDRRCVKLPPRPPPPRSAAPPAWPAAGPPPGACAPARPIRASGLINELADESMRRVSPGCLGSCRLPPHRGRRAHGQRLSPWELCAATDNPIARIEQGFPPSFGSFEPG